jgi:hypothetical protein
MTATMGMWECRHDVDGRDWCDECHGSDEEPGAAAVALEMVSRLAVSALQALNEGDKPELAFRLVEAITGVVADRLATDVKDQDQSDAIATAARAALGPIREHAERDADRDREEAAILAETERFMAAHGAKTIRCHRTEDDR